MNIEKAYELAKEQYAAIGVDTDAVLEQLQKTVISMHCWQGDDVGGFLFKDIALSGGIQTTGNYPGKANTAEELRADINKAMSLIPGRQKLNLHAIYADTAEKVDLDALEPHHFESWVQWAKEQKTGLDFNPTCFSHPMADSGFTISSADKAVRDFWIRHCKQSRKIANYFGEQLGETAVTNFWFPDGYKDIPIDREAPRYRMMTALDEVFADQYDEKNTRDALESKVFGIGAESYTVGSNEFCLGYAVSRRKLYCLDAGHFHPTEVISGKPIYSMNELDAFCSANAVRIGVIAVPAESAQQVCNRLVQNSIQAIWCFAPCTLKVPENIPVQYENMALSLAYLNTKINDHRGK